MALPVLSSQPELLKNALLVNILRSFKVSYLCVCAVVCVQAVILWLCLNLTKLIGGGGSGGGSGGAGSAAGCDWSPLTALSPCGGQSRGHRTCTASIHLSEPCDMTWTLNGWMGLGNRCLILLDTKPNNMYF